jgi:replicative DNA helicase
MPRSLVTVDEFLARSKANPAAWVIPGVMRQGWRAMLVATEGVGKSVIARQMALASSQGIHPFALKPIRPIVSLIVDCENPDDAISDGLSMVVDPLRIKTIGVGGYEEGRAWLWHEPQGINLRVRRWRNQFEAILREVRPELVCLGPLYKVYRVERGESDEQAAGEVQAILDDLRTRYRFALFIEHHAPKKSGGSRDMNPYGSSLWLRWPEFGLALNPLPEGTRDVDFRLDRFRGNRVAAAWPDRLSKSRSPGTGSLPWVAWWADSAWKSVSSAESEELLDMEEPF